MDPLRKKVTPAMITSSFDPHTPAVFGPEALYKAPEQPLFDVMILTFSKTVIDHALSAFDCHTDAALPGLNGDKPVYSLVHEGRSYGFMMMPVTAAHAGMMLEEAARVTGCRSFVLFGSCGALDSSLTEGKLIVPTEAYRDEGLSYHYAPAAPYITVKNAPRVAGILTELGIPHVQGRAWTTDGIFRETRGNMEKRRAEGCIAVDMECSGLQALCDFRGFSYYTFFYTGDLLDAPEWEQRILADASETDHQLRNFLVALEIARRLA
ncbi:MAG: nucleoside phosphorylase [Clostridiales bacterium]|nr:nucleoside phosphorylase [Clostridiales bacterium]